MLRFLHPEYLWLLLAVPLFAAGFFFLNRWRRQLLHRFIDAYLVAQLAPDFSLAKRIVKQSILLFALASLILALANPQVGTRLEEVKREGIDLFVVLDVSLSMKAEDIRPNRLEKAKRDVSSLLKKLEGDRVGLIVFAGDAFVQFPLTADYSAADLFIGAVDVDAVPVPGTTIGRAIEKALESFRKDLPTQKAIIIVSDGENTEGDVESAVGEAKKAGVRIYTVGMGTLEGAPIPLYNAGVRVDFKKDQAGSIVLSKLDEIILQKLSLPTNGNYRRASSGGNEIDEIFNELASLEKTEMGTMQVTGFEDQYQYPLALAAILLLLEFILSEKKGKLFARIRRWIPLARGLSVLFLLSLAGSLSAQTVRSHIKSGNNSYEDAKYPDAEISYKKALEKQTDSKEATFNLGNAYYKQQRFDESLRSYNQTIASTKDAGEQSKAMYNLGNSLFKSNKVQESLEAYKHALRLNPSDEDALYNYLLARERLKQEQQQKKDNKDNKDQKNQQQQQQNQKQNDQQKKQDQQKQQQNNQQQQAKQDQVNQQQKKNQMPKDQAERILEAMRNNEKDVQKQIRKREAVNVRIEKDW
ncbi:MAG: VWA domain-containing protein [bacterium]